MEPSVELTQCFNLLPHVFDSIESLPLVSSVPRHPLACITQVMGNGKDAREHGLFVSMPSSNLFRTSSQTSARVMFAYISRLSGRRRATTPPQSSSKTTESVGSWGVVSSGVVSSCLLCLSSFAIASLPFLGVGTDWWPSPNWTTLEGGGFWKGCAWKQWDVAQAGLRTTDTCNRCCS